MLPGVTPPPVAGAAAGASRLALSLDIIGGIPVTDVLVRDVPDDVVAALDARASRLGLSRSEYLRRRLAQEAVIAMQPVTVGDLTIFAATFADLGDPEVMKGAWE